jgi:peptide chain release factor subunit 1
MSNKKNEPSGREKREEKRQNDNKSKYKLKKMIKELEEIRGRHTELVSVYIPSAYNIVDVIGQLKDEQGTAANIKSKATRKNVMSALEKIIQHLRIFRQTPPNGLVVFAGNASDIEGKEDIRLWSFEPPEKLTTKIYWCDQTFVLEPLKEMMQERDVYGLIVLDAREANIGLLSGKSIKHLKHLTSTVPGKTVKGGMSQHRYDRLREVAINDFLKKAGDTANELLLKRELKGIIIGGPGPIKDRFAKGKYLNYMLLKKLAGVKNIGYTGEFGLSELVERAEDLLKESAIAHEKEILNKFFTGLEKDGPVTYGVEEVKQALEAGAVDTLLISEEFDWVRVNFECSCGFQIKLDVQRSKLKSGPGQRCKKCKSWMKPDKGEMLELTDVLIEEAEKTGTKVELISTETREGHQFKELGGLGAILRFKLS